jgi:PAS domain S-box-containing protein
MIRILHVDDNGSDLDLTELNLRKLRQPFALVWAYTGDQALKMLSVETYDCILCDYQMPGISGLELLKDLRSKGNETPFIFLTGQGNEEIAAEAFRTGADDYFTKEVGFAHYDRIANSIRRIVEARSHRQERKLADEKIKRLNLVLKGIRSVNQLITKESDIQRILRESCATLIETRGYRCAWIALLAESGGFSDVIGCGLQTEFSIFRDHLLAGNTVECVSRALESPGVFVIDDEIKGCDSCPLKLTRTGKGSLVVRMEHGGKIFGALKLTHERDLLQDEEELSLVDEVARDLAFALQRDELRKARDRAEEDLKESERRYRTLVELSPDAIYVHVETIIAYANNALGRLIGVADRDQMIGKSALDMVHPDYRAIVEQRFLSLSREGEALPFLQCKALRLDGSEIDVESTSLAVKLENKPAVLTILRDISGRT